MNPGRLWKALVYPLIPSVFPRAHEKRRKGLLYRWCSSDLLECQKEQNHAFWKLFLKPKKGGEFLEVGGNGIVGSHTLELELSYGWNGGVQLQGRRSQEQLLKARKCRVLGAGEISAWKSSIDLLAIHQLKEFTEIWKSLEEKKLQPQWVIVENRSPDPKWCRFLEGLGYKLRFFFHDDEYYKLKAKATADKK